MISLILTSNLRGFLKFFFCPEACARLYAFFEPYTANTARPKNSFDLRTDARLYPYEGEISQEPAPVCTHHLKWDDFGYSYILNADIMNFEECSKSIFLIGFVSLDSMLKIPNEWSVIWPSLLQTLTMKCSKTLEFLKEWSTVGLQCSTAIQFSCEPNS